MKHTQGPWWVDHHSNGVICVESHYTNNLSVCDFFHKDMQDGTIHQKQNAFNNAKLVAAAPEMYDALKSMQKYIKVLRWVPGFMKTFREAERALTYAGFTWEPALDE